MHRFTVGDYLLQTTKDRILVITSEKDVTAQGGKWLNWLYSIFQWFSTGFRKLKIFSKHLLPQSRVREF